MRISTIIIATKTVTKFLLCLVISALYCNQTHSKLNVMTTDFSDIIFEQFALGVFTFLLSLITFHFTSCNINYKNNTVHSTNILRKEWISL